MHGGCVVLELYRITANKTLVFPSLYNTVILHTEVLQETEERHVSYACIIHIRASVWWQKEKKLSQFQAPCSYLIWCSVALVWSPTCTFLLVLVVFLIFPDFLWRSRWHCDFSQPWDHPDLTYIFSSQIITEVLEFESCNSCPLYDASSHIPPFSDPGFSLCSS